MHIFQLCITGESLPQLSISIRKRKLCGAMECSFQN